LAHRSLCRLANERCRRDAEEDPMKMERMTRWMMMLTVLLCASSASAIDPAIKCQADKLRLAAKYVACRLNAEAVAARAFSEPSFDKCSSDFLTGWSKAEDRTLGKGTPCWTMNDASSVKSDLDGDTGALANWLSGAGK
jgi:hypothetical protein